MIKRIVIIIIITLSIPQYLFSKENKKNKPVEKENIIILNFAPMGASRKYTYYASIIPKTLTINLKNNPKYTIQRKFIELALVNDGDNKQIAEYKKKFGKTKKNKHGSDFIIIGSCQLGEFTQKEMDELSGNDKETPVNSEKPDSPKNDKIKMENKDELPDDEYDNNTLNDTYDDYYGTEDKPEEEDHHFGKDKSKKTNTPIISVPTAKVTKKIDQEEKHRMLFVKLQIIDLKAGKISTITKWSKEIGVLLKETTDDISDEIDKSVNLLISQRPEPDRPNTGLYGFLSPFSLGLKHGKLFPQGKLADQYSGDDFSQIFLQVQVTRNFALSANFLYSEFNTHDMTFSIFNSLFCYYCETHLLLWMGNRFHLSLNAGAGYGLLKISLVDNSVGGGPTAIVADSIRDFRPIFTGGFDLKVNLSPIQLIAGASYQYMMTENIEEFSSITAYVGAAFIFK